MPNVRFLKICKGFVNSERALNNFLDLITTVSIFILYYLSSFFH